MLKNRQFKKKNQCQSNLKFVSKPNFISQKILSKHLAAIHEIHDTVNEGVTGKMKDEFERIPVHNFNGLKPKNVLFLKIMKKLAQQRE